MKPANPIGDPELRHGGVTPAMAMLPLRLFLGITFVYGGVQKLSDPGFLNPGAPTYIGSQLHAFATGTPGGFLLRAFALSDPKVAGISVALAEIAIGLLTLAGLLTRAAATAGLLLNLLLFLTNSWNTYPYFLGSDIVFIFAWLPFVVAGASGQPALDNQLVRTTPPRNAGRGPRATRALPAAPVLTRRAAVGRALGVAGVATLGLGGIAALLKGSYRSKTRMFSAHTPTNTDATQSPASPRATPATAAPQTPATPPKSRLPPGAVKLGPSQQLPRGQAATYTDPGDGQPAIVIRQSNGKLTAFSAICTHQGCTVGYAGGGQIVCPCHGGLFNARTGFVEGGPPPSPLAPKRVGERNGEIYALPT